MTALVTYSIASLGKYWRIWWTHLDLNQGPLACEATIAGGTVCGLRRHYLNLRATRFYRPKKPPLHLESSIERPPPMQWCRASASRRLYEARRDSHKESRALSGRCGSSGAARAVSRTSSATRTNAAVLSAT